jgi:hypothetical protein
MVSRDWPPQHTYECIVGSPCRFCLARTLGRRANWLAGSHEIKVVQARPTKARLCAGRHIGHRNCKGLIRLYC